ncbi:tetratricopeptide repeat protein [Petrimonas sp.]|uniref:tetratricopeptide repeat protein n=1 Tax=Petrimonas sp. TaxID=2023866 RepID=UPI003F51824B
MNFTEATKIHSTILNFIENHRLKEAFDSIKQLASGQQNWKATEKATELETNYKYMIHYLVEGNRDPEQQKVYNHIVRDVYTLADDLLEQFQTRDSSSLFFEKTRLANVRQPISTAEYHDIISRQTDTFSVIGLLPDNDEKQSRTRQAVVDREHTIQDFFYSIFSSPRAKEEQIKSYAEFLNSTIMPVEARCLLVSALTLNILQRFDQKKVEFLLDTCNHPEPEVSLRALVGIVPVFRHYKNRWKYYPEITGRLSVMADDAVFTRRLMTVIIQFIQAHETEKITKKLTEEIIPEMMKLSPMIGKKINLEEWMGETGLEEKNPEWQKIIEDAGLTDKLQEFTDMQLGGADVFHSTFSNLKNYPFFNEMSNWFLPFNKQHSSLQQLFSDRSEGDSLLSAMLNTSMICNSDKYSFCFSMMVMPEQYRKMMISQLGAESDELKKMAEEELVLNPHQKEETVCKQYIQDLYRFFKLYPRKADFEDIFASPLDYHQLQPFQSVVSEAKNLERIALYYFEKNNFSEALDAYLMLTEKGNPTSETWQKIGYCRQMLGDVKSALEAYLKADLMDENNTWVLRRIAHCYRLLKEPESALQYFRRLEQLKPDDLNIQLNIGHCFLELDEYAEALNYYFKVDLLSHDNTRAWRSIAWCAFLSRKFDVAQRYYSQIIENQPNAHDFLNAGHVEFCLANTKKAVVLYVNAVRSTGSFNVFKSMFDEDLEELQKAGIDTTILPIILDKVRYDADFGD